MPSIREVLRIRDHPYLVSNPIEYLTNRRLLHPGIGLAQAVELLGLESVVEETVREAVLDQRFPPRSVWERLGTPQALVAFHAALMLLSTLESPWYTRRMALAVAKSTTPRLSQVGDRQLVLISRILGMDVEVHDNAPLRIPYRLYRDRVIHAEFTFSMHFIDYIRWAKRLSGDPRWKLTNQLIARSRVYMEREQLIRLLEEAIATRVEELVVARSKELSDARLPPPLDAIRERLQEELEKAAPPPPSAHSGWRRPGRVVYEAFPPCMAKIFRDARSGANLSHHQRFAIATFMIQVGASEDEIVDVFRGLPDFKERVTRYQVQHLMGARGGGKKYLPYNCDKMRTLNLCVADCGTRTPLQKYFQNLREKRRGREAREEDDGREARRTPGGGAPGRRGGPPSQ